MANRDRHNTELNVYTNYGINIDKTKGSTLNILQRSQPTLDILQRSQSYTGSGFRYPAPKSMDGRQRYPMHDKRHSMEDRGYTLNDKEDYNFNHKVDNYFNSYR